MVNFVLIAAVIIFIAMILINLKLKPEVDRDRTIKQLRRIRPEITSGLCHCGGKLIYFEDVAQGPTVVCENIFYRGKDPLRIGIKSGRCGMTIYRLNYINKVAEGLKEPVYDIEEIKGRLENRVQS
jgi:hypothetical protein